eukprot:TRINITY_DN19_c0_g1_i1.p1 TRINITY_DN19_c0_g1~~TRINITY_DN19_c0_g1_i1.p1  ORF type:complete len:1131 (+),score=219.49 TRINITY_DN19_c0_g1_i1:20-3412(+)
MSGTRSYNLLFVLSLFIVGSLCDLQNIAVLDCNGGVYIAPTFGTMGLNFQIDKLKTLYNAFHNEMYNRMKCLCSNITLTEFKHRHAYTTFEYWLHKFGSTASTKTPITCNVTEKAGFKSNLDDIKISFSFPSSCQISDYATGSSCAFQKPFPSLGLTFQLAVKACPNSFLPFLSVSCSGAGCNSIGMPCNSDSECGTTLKCTNQNVTVDDSTSTYTNPFDHYTTKKRTVEETIVESADSIITGLFASKTPHQLVSNLFSGMKSLAETTVSMLKQDGKKEEEEEEKKRSASQNAITCYNGLKDHAGVILNSCYMSYPTCYSVKFLQDTEEIYGCIDYPSCLAIKETYKGKANVTCCNTDNCNEPSDTNLIYNDFYTSCQSGASFGSLYVEGPYLSCPMGSTCFSGFHPVGGRGGSFDSGITFAGCTNLTCNELLSLDPSACCSSYCSSSSSSSYSIPRCNTYNNSQMSYGYEASQCYIGKTSDGTWVGGRTMNDVIPSGLTNARICSTYNCNKPYHVLNSTDIWNGLYQAGFCDKGDINQQPGLPCYGLSFLEKAISFPRKNFYGSTSDYSFSSSSSGPGLRFCLPVNVKNYSNQDVQTCVSTTEFDGTISVSCSDILNWDGILSDSTSAVSESRMFGSAFSSKFATSTVPPTGTGRTVLFSHTCDNQVTLGLNSEINVKFIAPVMNNIYNFILTEIKAMQKGRATQRGGTLSDEAFNVRYPLTMMDYPLYWWTLPHTPLADIGPAMSDYLLTSFSPTPTPVVTPPAYTPTPTPTPTDVLSRLAYVKKVQMPSTCTYETWKTNGLCQATFNGLQSLLNIGLNLHLRVQKCSSGANGEAKLPSFQVDCSGTGCDSFASPTFCNVDSECATGFSCVDLFKITNNSASTVDLFSTFITTGLYLDTPSIGSTCFSRDLGQISVHNVINSLIKSNKTSNKLCIPTVAVPLKSGNSTIDVKAWAESQLSIAGDVVTFNGLVADSSVPVPVPVPVPGGGPVTSPVSVATPVAPSQTVVSFKIDPVSGVTTTTVSNTIKDAVSSQYQLPASSFTVTVVPDQNGKYTILITLPSTTQSVATQLVNDIKSPSSGLSSSIQSAGSVDVSSISSEQKSSDSWSMIQSFSMIVVAMMMMMALLF